MKGAEVIVEMLIKYQVKKIFGVPGGQTNPLYESIFDHREQVTHILFREETNAVFAADGYAKISHTIGVADATLGPGTLRALPALAESYNSSIPIILFVGNNPLNWLPLTVYRGNASQAIDQVRLLEPVTKWVGQLTDIKSIPAIVRFAFRVASSGRPGPVAIDVPYSILQADEEIDEQQLYSQEEFSKIPALRIIPERDKVLQAARLIQQSSRPVIISGGGVFLSNALKELYNLCTTFKIPVATTINGKGSFPETHPLSLGVLGSLGGWDIAEKVVRMADLLIFIGSNVDQMTTMDWSLPAENQRAIHIDVDPAELGRTFSCNVSILGDAKASLDMINTTLAEMGCAPKVSWVEEIQTVKKDMNERLEYIPSGSIGGRLNPKTVMEIIDEFLSSKHPAIVVSDASSSSGWVAGFIQAREVGGRFIFPRGMAGLGYGIPAAIGATLAAKDTGLEYSRCFAIIGDGGAAYSITEIETAKRLKIPLVAIVLNDSALGWIKKIQEKSGKVISSELMDVSYAAVSVGLGGRGYDVRTYSDLKWSLEDCFDRNEPCLIDVKVESVVPYKPLSAYPR